MEQTPHQTPQSEPSPFSDTLSSILSNPEMMEKLRSIANQMPQATASSPTEPSTTASAESSVPSIPADGLASVLSDPQLMAKLPQMMAVLKPMLGAAAEASNTSPVPIQKERSKEDCRNDLLLALKPFLSPERCNAIDTMLRISRLGTIIKQIK